MMYIINIKELIAVHPVIHQCPVCQHHLHVKKLGCSHCDTVIENDFSLSKFASMTREQLEFVEVFLLSRGNIKEVEKALGISYPTVRGKLNDIIAVFGHRETKENHDEIITMLENNDISAKEAVELLKNQRGE